ncbi:carbonic anhydrase [soil metagenome]
MLRKGYIDRDGAIRPAEDEQGEAAGSDLTEVVSPADPAPPVRDPAEALERLQNGNRRYVAGKPHRFRLDAARRIELAEGQTPLATVFACVDSRVPVERVFDQAHGELLVVRTAAHVLDDAALGSIEFGVAVLATPLVVVLGHQRCGAVKAAISYARTGIQAPGKIQTIVNAIIPAVEETDAEESDHLERAIRAHSRLMGDVVRESELIGAKCEAGELRVVPAYYSMLTGEVEFLVD